MQNPEFFKTQKELHKWFAKNHNKQSEQWIGFYKLSTGKKSVTYAEALDEALAFGWIDGLRKSINRESYMIRYTPRKPGSVWSKVNIMRAKELQNAGAMHPAGLKAFNKRDEKRASRYSYERQTAELGNNFKKIFRKNKNAWEFFQSQPPSYRRLQAHWVMSAKKEETRLRRLQILINDSKISKRSNQIGGGKD